MDQQLPQASCPVCRGGGEHSTWAEVDLGELQGIVLGLLLFLSYILMICINDLYNIIDSHAQLCIIYREIQLAE